MSTYVNPTEHDNTTDITPAAVAPMAGKVWTVDRVRALGVTTTLATAASVLGISRSQAYRLAATDAFPAPLIRAGTRIIVPVAGLVRRTFVEHGHDVSYYENVEGGHGAAANNEQRTFISALTLEFLWSRLTEPVRSALPRQPSVVDAGERAQAVDTQ